jgi:hypothetical protein
LNVALLGLSDAGEGVFAVRHLMKTVRSSNADARSARNVRTHIFLDERR